MLFNSFIFLLAFLPATLIALALVERHAPQFRLDVLLGASILFYGWWDWRFVPLLVASIGLNWLAARWWSTARAGWIVTGAIVANLLVLALFKYAIFALGLFGLSPAMSIVLPLGISFFTFHHVMYLVDLRAGRAPLFDLTRYGLYIAFFPQVLAGPLVRWSEVMHQFERRAFAFGWQEPFARGLILLVMGLGKKLFLADTLASYANPVFEAAAKGETIGTLAAWQGMLGFTFQIYFDFSGYTDMALGIALMFGIVLPQNFDRPYRATSLADFWRRWHMTLSRFLRDYLYIPLGGNRFGLPVQLWALFATMALGGLWHGAGLTFVAWGVAHGLGLCAGLLWTRAGLPMPRLIGWALTFTFVTLCWVLFRATSFDAALRIYEGLLGLNGPGFGFKWRAIAAAAGLAMIGPTVWMLAQRARPHRALGWGLGVAIMLVLLKLNEDQPSEFIYFQF